MELEKRARFFAKVVNHLYAEQEMRGRLIIARRGARHLSLGIRLSNPLHLDRALSLADNLALATNTAAVLAQRRQDSPGLVSYLFQLQNGYWESYTRADLMTSQPGAIGIGLGEARRQIDFSFDDVPHALIAGATKVAGKTETVKSILAGLFTTYRPDQLQAIVCDYHNDYVAFENAAHLVYPVVHDIDGIDRAIAYADQELVYRRERNRRNATPWVVVIDEAEEVLDGQRLVSVQNISKEAAKFRIHLIVSTQKPTQSNLPDLIHNLNYRLVGKVDSAHTSAMLTGQPRLNCEKLTGKGDFVRVSLGEVDRLQVALATEAEIAKIPRGEIAQPEVELVDIPRSENFEPATNGRGPGRPVKEIEPRYIVRYLAAGPDNISMSQAERLWGVKRTSHERNRDFAQELETELKILIQRMLQSDPKAVERFFRRLTGGSKNGRK
jgi:DNA segregation ATPase FtsK/SpoIIIE-like protein